MLCHKYLSKKSSNITLDIRIITKHGEKHFQQQNICVLLSFLSCKQNLDKKKGKSKKMKWVLKVETDKEWQRKTGIFHTKKDIFSNKFS